MSYIDTRDLWTELVDLRDRQDTADQAPTDPEELAEYSVTPLDEDEVERLKALETLADEIGEDTMRNGETMIPVYEFPEYAEELAEDIGAINRELSWPLNHIDWDAAARELAYDYSEVTWEGIDYYIRIS